MDSKAQTFNIVGPCSMESRTQIEQVFKVAEILGLTYVRAQVFKPRTNPNSFQGMADEGNPFKGVIDYQKKAWKKKQIIRK